MTVGPRPRSDLSRSSVDSRVNSATFKGSFIQAPILTTQSLTSQQAQVTNGLQNSVAIGSPISNSRDASPSRQVSGSIPILDPYRGGDTSDDLLDAPKRVLELHTPKLDPAVLESVPSFGYERGCRALWLDRHASLHRLNVGQPSPRPQTPCNKVAGSDCLAYCPSWTISQSMVWSLAKKYVEDHPQPPLSPASTSTSSLDLGADQDKDQDRLTNVPATQAPSEPASPPSTLPRCTPSRPQLPLPSGIGIGLSTPPRLHFKRAALCLLSKGRMELRRTLHQAHQEALAPEAPDGSALPPTPAPASTHFDAATVTHDGGSPVELVATAGVPAAATASPEGVRQGAAGCSSSSSSSPAVGSPSSKRQRSGCRGLCGRDGADGGGGSGGDVNMLHSMAHAVADAVTECPTARQVVRRRVRAVMAGVSVVYAAANLGGAAVGVMHADFSHDAASAAKAVLDFVITAPSVTGIAGELLQLGVAVGLGVAQRRAPDL